MRVVDVDLRSTFASLSLAPKYMNGGWAKIGYFVLLVLYISDQNAVAVCLVAL